MKEQTIIALSGRKGAGKSEVASFLFEYFTQQGISIYSCAFADTLKDFCIETLGLDRYQCYGSEEQKGTSTEYRWEDVEDLFIRWQFMGYHYYEFKGEEKQYVVHPLSVRHKNDNDYRSWFWISEHMSYFDPELKEGYMTGREVMQLLGTNLVRKVFGNVWAKATIRRIKKQDCSVAVITDNRFPDEIEAVLAEPQGYIVRLTRSPFGLDDKHPSEASLDNFVWDREKCFVVDNRDMSIAEQNEAVIPVVQKITQRSR